MSLYARPNEFGIIETPYAKVEKGVITKEIVYMNALEEEQYAIAHAATPRDENGKHHRRNLPKSASTASRRSSHAKTSTTSKSRPTSRSRSRPRSSRSSKTTTPTAHSWVRTCKSRPFRLWCRTRRMWRPASKSIAARDSGRLILAEEPGEVTYADARKITVKGYFERQDQGIRARQFLTHQRLHDLPPASGRLSRRYGEEGRPLADTSTSVGGQLAIGQNVRVAFLPWFGTNFEDAIVISEKLAKEAKLHFDPHGRVRLRRARHQARSRGHDPRHSQRF